MIPQPAQAGEVRRETGLADPQPSGPRWRHAWSLFRDYWTSKDWKFAWFALILLLAFQFGTASVLLATNRWEQGFFESIEQRDSARFGALIFVFFGIMALQVAMILTETFIGMLLGIRWRSFLTGRYVDRWMSNNRYTEIERLRIIDNPDQRIAEDLANITGTSDATGILHLCLRMLGSIVTAVTFSFVLLETAEPIRFTAFGTAVSIPGSTVWYGVAYVLIGSWITAKIGQRFIRASMRQQHFEADFRAALIHVRRNAPQIGLAKAVSVERVVLYQAFEQIRHNYRTIISSTLSILAAQSLYQRLATMLPLFLLVPRYFAGAISFGQLMGARGAFEQLTFQLGYFVQAYQRFGQQVSYFNRMKGLDDAIGHPRPAGIALSAGVPAGTAIAVSGLALHRPHGETLVEVGDWSVRQGERWALRGPSGAGKSTLVRALAGLWPDGAGSVALANDTHTMFVPQRLYLPMGTLKAAVCFPDATELHDDAAIAALLDRVRLGHLTGDLHAVRMWQEELSPGEQQRVALARILLHRPTLLVLDEATSALDADNAAHFYRCVRDDLPDATVLSVIHDETLLRFHSHALTIEDGRAAASELPDQPAER